MQSVHREPGAQDAPGWIRSDPDANRLVMAAVIALFGVALQLFPEQVFAHHGAAAYDRAARIEIGGIVQRFAWINPHALIELNVTNSAGHTEQWTAETAGLVILARAGWSRQALAPGDRCKLIGIPARNGSRTLILERLVLSDGRVLTNFIP